jgi:hypothetical protein
MATITGIDGRIHDLGTMEIVGRAEGAPTIVADPRAPTAVPDVETEGADRVTGALKNLSWGFNSALFALPDAATRGIGKALGMNDKEVFTFGNYFNKGQTAPRNIEERFARAIGEGVGATMPFTGTLAYVARARPLVSTAKMGTMKPLTLDGKFLPKSEFVPKSIIKGIADDTIKFVQQSPRLAAAMDIAFGAGFEVLRQTVKETVSDDNPHKELYEHLLPTAAFVGLPMATSLMPTAIIGKYAANKVAGLTSGLKEVDEKVMQDIPKYWKLPGLKIIPKVFVGTAEKKLGAVFGDIKNSPESQAALKAINEVMLDPRFAETGFELDSAQKTMYPALLQAQEEALNKLGPAASAAYKQRKSENNTKFDALFNTLAPEARQPVMEAFQAAQAERQSFFNSLLQGQKNLTEEELLSISERLGPQNMDMINNELRGALLGAMEFDANMRKNVLNRMGLRQGTTPEGLDADTRQNGKSLFPSQNMEAAALALIKKYTPERPSKRVRVPEPIALLQRFVKSQQVARDRLEREAIAQMTDNAFKEQVKGSKLQLLLEGEKNPQNIETAKKVLDDLKDIFQLLVKSQRPGVKLNASEKKVFAEWQRLGTRVQPDGTVVIATGGMGDKFRFNPKQIVDDAALIASESSAININLPEALDYLSAAARYRNDSLVRYNSAMNDGASRVTDAQRILDKGSAVYTDIEKLILDHVPTIRVEYQGMKNVLSDYRAGFEQKLPLLMAQRTGRGDAFLLANEQLLQKAFANAGNLRQLQVSLSGTPQFDELLLKGTIDWLRGKGVLAADGIVSPNRIRSVLDKNRNIVEALPDAIQAKLQNEIALADDYVKRMGELNDRRILAKDDELDRLLKKASRPDADPRSTLIKAIDDPATMRVLVDQLGKDPEQLAALRRAVFYLAKEGALKGGALSSFMDRNEKSLAVLYKNTKHLADLKKLAESQRRINAVNVVGDVPLFESLDDSMKRLFNIGIGAASTTYRTTNEGRLSPTTALISFLIRATGGLETTIYNNMFRHAMEDPKFAANLTSMSTPEDAKKVLGDLQKIGIYRSMLFKNLGRAGTIEAGQAVRGDQTTPIAGMQELPVVPRGTSARDMLRKLPPAPPTTGFSPSLGPPPGQSRFPATAPKGGTSYADIPLMYPAMFPNDPISGILEQRRRQIEQQQMQQPPQQAPQ